LIGRATTHAALAFALAGAVGVVAPAAGAETAYRYWSYWTSAPGQADGQASGQASGQTQWSYATQGSGTHVPPDGSVEGWRFGIGGEAARITPGIAADFDAVCSQTPKPESGKRVAVVIDSGTPQEAPPGEAPPAARTACVVTDSAATGYQVLLEVASVRTDAGFVCGIDGYPSSECAPLVDAGQEGGEPADAVDNEAPAVSAVSAGTESTAEASGIGTPLATAVALSLLALAGFGIWRRRRSLRGSVT